MAEKGIDIAKEQPKQWTTDMLEAVNVVITMGCGDSCPILPGRRYEDWVLPDPAGQTLDAIRPIRDEIEQRVQTLLDQLGVGAKGGGDPFRQLAPALNRPAPRLSRPTLRLLLTLEEFARSPP
jgi:hypothetical protein